MLSERYFLYLNKILNVYDFTGKILGYQMASTFKSSKKCLYCGEWSVWKQEATDTCEHCGALLDDEKLLRTAAREAAKNEKKGFELDIIEIYPTDSGFVVFYKRVIQALQYSFIAIVSFILWFLTMLAG